MQDRRHWSRALVLAIPLAVLVAAAPASLSPGPEDRCPVCGMLVAPHPAWLAQLQFADGSAAFFDGSRCLFRYLLTRDTSPAKEITASYVTSYYDLKPISLESAHFVTGSDVTGPMGPELVPLRSRDEGEEFLRDHRGQAIVRSTEVTLDLLRSLR